VKRYELKITVDAESPIEAVYAAGDVLIPVATVADLAALGDALEIREVPA
jgi:hypothetical protein